MAQVNINILRNNRIKNLALGGLLLISMILSFTFVASNFNATKPIAKSEAMLIIIVPILVIGVLAFIPFGQILESNNGKLILYYRLGSLKFRTKNMGKARAILLEQDELKYYCIRIQLINGDLIDMEKHSTLDWATIRYEEYKKLIDHGKVAV
ncbi:MAG: hypothetical protein HOP30_08255 [Cyclobacteriaceae bacterium]|nr:hypothetical protein [Cyclobacteriaceae bacterium]